MPLKNNELARREHSAVECRADGMRLSWMFKDIPTGDAHTLDCRFACSIRIAGNPADRRMFVEVFLASRESATAETIAEHFARSLRTALASLAAQQKAAEAVDGKHTPAWIASLTKAADPIAFAAGLELLPPFQLDIESATLQRQRLEDIARARADERTANQLQHLHRAGELLKQFQAMRHSAPDLPAGKLLDQIGPAELRGVDTARAAARERGALGATAICASDHACARP